MCLLLLAMVPAWAADLPQEVTDAAPPAAEELEGKDFSGGIAALLEQGTTLLGEALRGNLRGAVLILGVVLLCGVADAALRTPESPMRRFLPMAGAAAIAVLSLGSMKSLLGLGTQTIEELDVFSKALLPTLAAAVAAGGGAVTAGTGQVIAVCFADALITLIRGLLLPMTYFLAAAATADAMLPRHGLGTVAKAASRVVTWLLTGSLVLFTGYLTLSGAVSTSADALTVQVTRSAVGAMPVVGRILSDAAGSVLAGAGVVKNAIGVFGLLGVLAACLGPFVRLGVQYLLYKLTAFLAGMTAAPELAKLIDALGGVFGLMLGMTGRCALLLLISISSAILVGLTAAALAVSLLTAMLPKGETIRRIAGLAGGLILLLAVVQPLLRVRWEELTWRYETYQREMDRQTEAYQAAYANSLSGDIADRTAAYISEKAASLGIDCRVQVEVRTEDGLPLPYGASLDVERDQVLSDYMAQELGIPASRQSWQPEE